MNVEQLWRAWGTGLAVIGIPIVLWGGAGPPEHDPRDVADLINEVPVVPVVAVSAADLAELETGRVWGTAAAPAPARSKGGKTGAGNLQWTLGGVFMKDDRRQVVVHFKAADKAPALLGEGDALPDGARIVTITRDKVRVELPGTPGGTRWLTVNREGPSGPVAGD